DLAAHFRVPAFHFRKLAEAQNETTRHAGSDERRALEEVMLLPMALERAVNEEPPQWTSLSAFSTNGVRKCSITIVAASIPACAIIAGQTLFVRRTRIARHIPATVVFITPNQP